jgi:hypothetical protein
MSKKFPNQEKRKSFFVIYTAEILLGLITILGAYLRLANLSGPPLWIDEALFAGWIKEVPRQEFFTLLIAKVLPTNEFYLRLPVALAGTLTIPAFYWATGKSRKSLYGAAFIAVFPILVFWSRLARPYAFAGLFMVLGWRWWGFSIIAILSTPMSLISLNLFRLKEIRYRWYYAGLGVVSFLVYFIRPDVNQAGDFFDPVFLFTMKRFWYVPILTILLYCCSYLPDRYFTKDPKKKLRAS